MYEDCSEFVPFSQFDWTFARKGHLKWNPTAYCLIAAFCAVAYWMCIELLVLVHVTFKRKRSLYFWSIVVTTLGLVLQTTGYLIKEFAPSCPPVLTTIICKIGWVSNVTGFSIVLWSRLHLVVHSPTILRGILIMIIVNGITMHTPIVVFEFGLISRHHDTYYHPMEIMERVQQTVFTLQETIISGLYIFHTTRFLSGGYESRTRNVIRLLVAVQALVISLDSGLTAFDYKNMFTLKCTIHPFVYALKLKLEFIVLNQLLGILKKGLIPSHMGLSLPSYTSSSLRQTPSPSTPTKEQTSMTKRPALFHSKSASSDGTSNTQSLGPASQYPTMPTTSALEIDEEDDLVDVVGRPDDIRTATMGSITDAERQYLGRYES